jgi:hypothetical protein
LCVEDNGKRIAAKLAIGKNIHGHEIQLHGSPG